MDSGHGRTELREQFARAREREINGALLVFPFVVAAAVERAPGSEGAFEAAGAVVRGRPGHAVYRLDGSVSACLVSGCSAAEARALADDICRGVAPSAVCIGIVNFYEFFMADGTAEDVAREIERVALQRLETAIHRGPGAVCDVSDPVMHQAASRPSVLVVEPDPVSVELLTAALEAAGFDVRTFQNGESALASLEASPPDLVICEAMTPRLNGFAIRERLRASAPLEAIPFILVSHRKTEELIRKAVDADIRHYLRKPLSITEIVGLAANLTRSAAR